MMGRTFSFLLIAPCLFFIQSCSSPLQKPMVTHGLSDQHGITIVSTSASRRANFVADLDRARYICMEPQPDVREDIAKAFLAAAMAGADTGSTEKSAEASAKIATISQLLTAQLNRSIAIEYLKASLFALCQQKYGQFARATTVLEHEQSSTYTKNKAQSNMSPYAKYEAYDFHKIGSRAQLLALAEIIYGDRKVEQKPSSNPAAEINKYLTQIQQIQNSLDRTNTFFENRQQTEREKLDEKDEETAKKPDSPGG